MMVVYYPHKRNLEEALASKMEFKSEEEMLAHVKDYVDGDPLYKEVQAHVGTYAFKDKRTGLDYAQCVMIEARLVMTSEPVHFAAGICDVKTFN